MDAIFPLPQQDTSSLLTNFLDRAVTVNLESAGRRNIASAAETSGVLRATTSGLEFGTGDRMLPEDQALTNGNETSSSLTPEKGDLIMIFDRTSPEVVVGEEADGKTVKSLSRLWRYLGGNSPND